MKLFLASRAAHPQSIKDINNFVGGLKGKNIAYIPTAANAEEGYGVWKTGGSWQTLNTLETNITPVVLEECKSKEALSPIYNADIIWFAGGYWGYLMYWLRFLGLEIEIKPLLEQGKVYIGSSAGANIASKSLVLASWYKYDLQKPGGERGGDIFPGLGLVDFDIYPHYQDELYEYVKTHYKGNKIYLLKDGEAVTVVDNKVTVLGEERIIRSL